MSVRRAQRVSTRDESGAALVEFALIAPLLLVIVFGILDFGRAMNYLNSTTQLANVGARLAAVNEAGFDASGAPIELSTSGAPCAELKTYLLSQASGEMQTMLSAGTVKLDLSSGTTIGSPATVTVDVDFPWIPFLGSEALGGATSKTLHASATMRLERDVTGAVSC